MPKTELVQAELAVIEAGITLARLKVGAVETKIEEVKASLESVEVAGRMAAGILAIEAEVQAVKENILKIDAAVKLVHFEDGQAGLQIEEKTSALRAHIELNNDKLCVMARELDLLDRDIRHPRFTVADMR